LYLFFHFGDQRIKIISLDDHLPFDKIDILKTFYNPFL